jgi:hypothetical protein
MSDLRTAAQQALEALENARDTTYSDTLYAQFEVAITALKTALAQQEPVTWGVDWGRDNDQSCCTIIKRHADGVQEVVAVEYAPPRREWVSLTPDAVFASDEIMAANASLGLRIDQLMDLAHAVEQACKERNT